MSEITKRIKVATTNLNDLLIYGEVQLWRNIPNSDLKNNPFRMKSGEYIICEVPELELEIVCLVANDTLYRKWNISDKEADMKGYSSAESLKACYKSIYYPSIDFENDYLVVISLEVPKLKGVPTIKLKTPK